MKNKIRNIAFSAMFTAIICILSQVAFITPSVPLTLQTFAVALCGYTMSLKWSFACVSTYIALGSFGLPVFSSFKGGAQVLLGPTGGFLFGLTILTVACSLSVKCAKKYLDLVLNSLGLAVCHILGIIQYHIVTQNNFWVCIMTASLPFILKDVLSLLGARLTANLIKSRIKGLKL